MKNANFVNMKYLGFLSLTILVLFSSCEEEPPFIDLTPAQKVLKDTTYVTANIPAQQDKVTLLEDISGVNCVNCPDAAVKADEIKSRTGGKVIVATLIPEKSLLPEFTDPKDVFTDLMQSDVNQLLNFIGPPSGLPTGMINRGDFGNGITLAYPRWDGHVNDEILETTSVNIELDKELSADKSELFIDVKVTFTANQTDSVQNLTIFLVENDITGVQKGRSGIMNNYVFQHVVRDYATNAVGDPLAVKLEQGRVVEREYKLNLNADWVVNNCEIIALVHSGAGKYVYQSASIKLK